MVEKPTFMSAAQVDNAYHCASKFQCKIFPVFQNRYNQAVQRVKQALINNELGEIRLLAVRVRWCRPQQSPLAWDFLA